jgi:hypothetical protein
VSLIIDYSAAPPPPAEICRVDRQLVWADLCAMTIDHQMHVHFGPEIRAMASAMRYTDAVSFARRAGVRP